MQFYLIAPLLFNIRLRQLGKSARKYPACFAHFQRPEVVRVNFLPLHFCGNLLSRTLQVVADRYRYRLILEPPNLPLATDLKVKTYERTNDEDFEWKEAPFSLFKDPFAPWLHPKPEEWLTKGNNSTDVSLIRDWRFTSSEDMKDHDVIFAVDDGLLTHACWGSMQTLICRQILCPQTCMLPSHSFVTIKLTFSR